MECFFAEVPARLKSLQLTDPYPQVLPAIDGRPMTAVLKIPHGNGITLIEMMSRHLPKPANQNQFRFGEFGYLAFPVSHVEESLHF